MNVTRREALHALAAISSTTIIPGASFLRAGSSCSGFRPSPVFGIQPVVFDGKWNLKEPPEGQTGYWDTREFDVSVGARWTGTGDASNLKAATVAPVQFPEQEISDLKIETDGSQAFVNQLTPTAAQLQVAAPRIRAGQSIGATAKFRLKISRVFHDYQRDQFPAKQDVPDAIAREALGNSPGIRSELLVVKKTVEQIVSRHEHPWESAKKFFAWVWENIEGQTGPYTSVRAAMEKRVGDCEERAGVFIALCRAAGIPARLVWVPNHSWAEFCLLDETGQPHWIPAHTAAYNWFGWTGAHEVVLQKGDRVPVPGQNKTVRLINDWYSHSGRKPRLEFNGHIKPVAQRGVDPGPGERTKDSKAAWNLVGSHPDDKLVRV